MLDEEYAGYFGCRPDDLRAHGITALSGGRNPLTVAVTAGGGIVSSALLDQPKLTAAVDGCSGSDLLDQVHLGRLIDLLPERAKPWSVGEQNVLSYCIRETFRPYARAPAEPVRPGDAFWQEVREAEREFVAEGKTWRVQAAFAVYVKATRASTAKLIDQGRDPFCAVGVDTAPDCRGRGYAKACVSGVTAWALERELVPLYNTQTINTASVAVARAVGYTEYIRYLIVS
jgi:GNAT superfamily N-acetyltransferase